ncbi:MAG: hypothetical protein IJ567_04550 [Lachnospiraceae bacterium]|nr:hypothetical protein [Lachnospiraceae bacterium]
MGIFENTILVKRKATAGQLVMSYLILFLCVVSIIGFVLTLQLLFVVLILITVLLWYLLRSSARVEYEYSYIEGRLSFARIRNKKHRKELANIEMEELILIAPADDPELNSYHRNTELIRKDYTSGEPDRSIYEAVYHGKNHVIDIRFEPDRNMLDMMAKKYGSKIKREHPMA